MKLLPTRQPRDASESWSLEVQIHPGNIRRRVRYLFLARQQMIAASVLALFFLSGLACAAAFAPGVIGGILNRQEYYSLVAERARQGERLQELVGRLDQLESRTDTLHLRMNKIRLAYGLPAGQSRGKGGYPFAVPPAPDSIYSGTIQQGNSFRSRIGESLGVLDAFLREVRAFEQEHRDQVSSTPSVCPLRGADFVLTSPFGRRRSPFTREFDFHAGLDLAAPPGKPVYSPADGTVVFAGVFPMGRSINWWRYGNLVMVRNGDQYVTLFGHLSEIRVRAGQKVHQGDPLGAVGNSGWSTNPHLHYEVRHKTGDDWVPVDPLIYILDHRWQNEERLLLQAQSGPPRQGYEPLPSFVGK